MKVPYETRTTALGRQVCAECGYVVPQHSEDCAIPFRPEDPDPEREDDGPPDLDVCDDCGGINGGHRFGIDH